MSDNPGLIDFAILHYWILILTLLANRASEVFEGIQISEELYSILLVSNIFFFQAI